MPHSSEELATAFSRHAFAEVYPYFAADVRWNQVGGDVLVGKAAVIEGCDASAAYLAGVTTSFEYFTLFAAGERVVVESTATYREDGGDVSVVASCDIYAFAADLLTAITSYTIALAEPG